MSTNNLSEDNYARGFHAGHSAGRLAASDHRNEQRLEYANMHARVTNQRREIEMLLNFTRQTERITEAAIQWKAVHDAVDASNPEDAARLAAADLKLCAAIEGG